MFGLEVLKQYFAIGIPLAFCLWVGCAIVRILYGDYRSKSGKTSQVEKYTNSLLVRTHDGQIREYTIYDWRNGNDESSPWKEVFEWFANEKSESFILKLPHAQYSISRKSVDGMWSRVDRDYGGPYATFSYD